MAATGTVIASYTGHGLSRAAALWVTTTCALTGAGLAITLRHPTTLGPAHAK